MIAIIASEAARSTTLPFRDQLHEPRHLAGRGHAEAELLLLFREHVGMAVAEGGPEELGAGDPVGDEPLVHVRGAHERDEEVRGRVVAHRDHQVEEVAHGEDEAAVQALEHAGAVDLRGSRRGGWCRRGAMRPSAIWWKTSTITADLDDARGRERRVRVHEDGLAGGEVLGRDAHGAAQRAHRLLDPRLEAGGGEGRGGHQEEGDEDGEGTVEAHAA